MICAIHEDGRVVLMAQEYNLKPMILDPQSGKWGAAKISGEELNDFMQLNNKSTVSLFLYSAIKFAELNTEFKVFK